MTRSTLVTLAAVLSCASSGTEPASEGGTRTYRMGFSWMPPRPTVPEVLRTIDSVGKHADGALMVVDVPWKALLADTSASQLVRRDNLPVAQLFRQRGLPIVATLELANGLDRTAEAEALVALGRSIAEPAVQRAYREFAVAFDSIVRPEWLGLAMETNLIRAAAKPTVYAAVVTMTNAAAAELRAAGSPTKLMVSVQVETAWGRLAGAGGGVFVGVQRDRTDFPFVQVLGLSSYPYLGGFATPEQMPLDYYTRVAGGWAAPMMVVEGGWTSGSVPGVASSPELQARYIRRQMQLADEAKLLGVYQITFTDLDLSSFPVPSGSILPLFAELGLVDASYRAKPALAVWDSVRGRRFAPQ
ncbi:MAG TPA: hypothetical protein VFS59_15485 [Gemmatimonadaceae bacterium]|nr:hypothetical protein [Gemmatimonadaceae bacterium]